MKDTKTCITDFPLAVGVLLLTFLAGIVAIASVALLLGGSLHVSFFYFAALMAVLIAWKYFPNYSVKWWGITVFVCALMFCLALVICGRTYDCSWDGNAYHKLAIGYLRYGWNPVYETMENFMNTEPFVGAVQIGTQDWAEFFPKASWYLGAVIYQLTGNIETGKAINLVAMIALGNCAFFYFDWLFSKSFSGKYAKVLTAVLTAIATFSPITMNQLLTFYVDTLLSSLSMITFIALFALTQMPQKKRKPWWIILFSAAMIGCNLKFTSGAIIGIPCALVYCVWMWKLWRSKQVDKKERNRSFAKVTGFYIALGNL